MKPDELNELSQAFERDGFVNGGVVLDGAPLELCASRRSASPTCIFAARNGPLPRPCSRNSHMRKAGALPHDRPLARVPPFGQSLNNQRLLTIAAALTGARTLQPWSDTLQYKPATLGGPVKWHQDGFYHAGIDGADRSIGAWIALDDADENSGCMWMVPGSYKWGLREPYLYGFHHLSGRWRRTLLRHIGLESGSTLPSACR
jgi:hypothetical protein